MNDVLMVMNGRTIERCLESFERLPVDRAYFTGYTEVGLEPAIAGFIESTDYENYHLISDDVIAEAKAFDLVRAALEEVDIATGYCNIDPTSDLVTVCIDPLKKPWPSTIADYPFIHKAAANSAKSRLMRTSFVSYCMTGMKKAVWESYPFQCFRGGNSSGGWGSDYNLSWRLQSDGVPAFAVRGAFSEHLGGNLRLPATLPGRVKPTITLKKHGH